MTLEQERQLLEALRFAKWCWLVIGTLALIVGSLTNRNPAWCVPMVIAAIAVASEARQEHRVRKLEKGQQP